MIVRNCDLVLAEVSDCDRLWRKELWNFWVGAVPLALGRVHVGRGGDRSGDVSRCCRSRL